MSRFEIAFSGQLVAGARPEVVKANLAKLFQADAQRIELLFSGRRVVIKNNLDAASAEKYRSVLERAGAIALVSEMEVEEVVMAPPPALQPSAATPPSVAAAPAPAGRLQVAPRDGYMAAFAEVDAPDFGLAPLGADLQDAKAGIEAPKLDLAGLSIAPVGSDMGQARAEAPPPAPDTSHLRLQD
ncbi:TPA: hypothetical protein L6B08_10105 [Pseudomonas aeruginosa]|uniref:hypothetical protein n=1 Tax=Pseudomonas aeruginosa group TaxID=136841 RepID=UPI00071B942F|nr:MULTISPECIES: hypothetical protein [Pseudomonas aeruginosa group]KSC53051.1 hypothetical protein AO882_01845 [Pseudomonas paraeruginosa]KSL20533.1 hypothetical protein APA44_01850 [Pseudomonas aeruginosa]MBH8715977.1 hypothetical protein [Pseudomonas aeruginosa]MBH9341017.1 hypothetical protein [Pseudomonas aeruginosa]MBH9395025.1 hypothetical protein [Pseudomonas aeruginosa]